MHGTKMKIKDRAVYLNEECEGRIHMVVNKYCSEQQNDRNFVVKSYRKTYSHVEVFGFVRDLKLPPRSR